MKHSKFELLAGLGALVTAAMLSPTLAGAQEKAAKSGACPGDNGGLSLPKGFCATVFADRIGHARHMAVAPDGTLYVNTWSGRYYKTDPIKAPDGGMIVALKDTKGDGKADKIERFGGTLKDGDAGGTGIALFNNKLYVETNDKIVRYGVADGDLAPKGQPETVVSGLPTTGDHPMHPIVIDAAGQLFIDLGSATNACQPQNRMPHVDGAKPCKELETRGGIWRYDANATDQKFSPAERYATGLRNGEGLAFDAKGRFYATQHGRDQLAENWQELFTQEQGATLPAEEVVQVSKGADFGWPYCYFDGKQSKLVLAPEYGGDGKKAEPCLDKNLPIAVFPAHWAPNALAIYEGKLFPKAYGGALLIAFHGSWNRAPSPQAGYDVVVQPMSGGQPSGKYQVFADGFAGADKNPGQATHRPTGLAIAPDGALYISDDIAGTIWRVTYQGDKSAPLEGAPPAAVSTKTAKGEAVPPEGMHPDAGLKPPPGGTQDEVALGQKIFFGKEKRGTCAGCHGDNAKGTPVGPSLVKKDWMWGDGSPKALTQTISQGVMKPKEFPGAMPPMGGAQLSESDAKAVAAYVWSLNN